MKLETGCSAGECLAEYNALANVYDVWAAADPAAASSHDFYVQLSSKSDGVVVELGVGTGRIAVDVAERGKTIIGVDIAESMLDQCRRRAEAKGVVEHIQLICCDVRDLCLQRKARLITLPFRTIGHFLSLEDKRAALRNIYTQLEPGGLFVFDHYVFSEAWARAHHGIPRLMQSRTLADGSGLFIWDTYLYDFATQQMNCLITIERSSREGLVVRKTHCPLHFSWLLPEQIRQMAEETGFTIEGIYGDFAHADFGPAATEQVWYLRRPQ